MVAVPASVLVCSCNMLLSTSFTHACFGICTVEVMPHSGRRLLRPYPIDVLPGQVCTEVQREVLLDKIQRHLAQLKRLTYGKHIVSRVEKLLINAASFAKEARAGLPPKLAPVAPRALTAAPAPAPLPHGGGPLCPVAARSSARSA